MHAWEVAHALLSVRTHIFVYGNHVTSSSGEEFGEVL